MPLTLVIANWKANKNQPEVISWMDKFSSALPESKNLRIVICPAAIHFTLVKDLIQKYNLPDRVSVGLQDLSAFPGGTYTGEITGRMAEGMASYVILGHSERRKYFKETAQQAAQKSVQALDNNIIPVVSVDRDNFREVLRQFDDNELSKIVIMYEPPEAISIQDGPVGTGKPAEVSDIEEMIKILKQLAPDSKILYGGSVKSGNIVHFSSIPGLSGIVVGSASLDPDEFIKIIRQI